MGHSEDDAAHEIPQKKKKKKKKTTLAESAENFSIGLI